MKARVKIYLNERTQRPSVNAPNPSFLKPNETVKIVDIVNGDPVEGNNVWYEIDNGSFVWSGGVEGLRSIGREVKENPSFDQTLNNYPGDGSGIGVAVLDSGVSTTTIPIANRIKEYQSFIKGKSKKNITPHGTQVAGIIASDDAQIRRNKSDLYCFRVANENDRVDSQAVLTALQEIDTNPNYAGKIDIVNMSIEILLSMKASIEAVVQNLIAKNIIVVVAGGENNFLNNIGLIRGVIKVGVFDDFIIPEIRSKGLKYDIGFWNQPIPTYTKGSNAIDSSINQDSAYTAFVTSLIARRIQGIPIGPLRHNEVNKFLTEVNEDIKSTTHLTRYQPYK